MPRQRSSTTVLSLIGWNPCWPFEKFPRKRQNPVLLWLLILVQALYMPYVKTNDSLTILVLPNSFRKVTEQKPQELVPSIAQTIPLPFGTSRLLVNWWGLYSHIDSYRNQALSNHKKHPWAIPCKWRTRQNKNHWGPRDRNKIKRQRSLVENLCSFLQVNFKIECASGHVRRRILLDVWIWQKMLLIIDELSIYSNSGSWVLRKGSHFFLVWLFSDPGHPADHRA